MMAPDIGRRVAALHLCGILSFDLWIRCANFAAEPEQEDQMGNCNEWNRQYVDYPKPVQNV